MGIPRGRSALSGIMGQHTGQQGARQSRISHHARAATDSIAAIGSAVALTATAALVPAPSSPQPPEPEPQNARPQARDHSSLAAG
eukprot:5807997-Prymnesium_polylepis.1